MSHQRRKDARQLDLFSLMCLVTLVDKSSVSAAAKHMEISQPAMSQILSRLRALSGDPLLVRGTSTMLPTSRAVELAKTARQVIRLMEDDFWGEYEFVAANASQSFSIMGSDYVQAVLFPPLMKRIVSESPNSLLRAVSPNLERLYHDLQTGEIDLAIGFFTTLPPTLRSVGLFQDRLVCALPFAKYKHHESLSLDEYLELRHVAFFIDESSTSTMERHTDHAVSLVGGERKVALRTQTLSTMLDAVSQCGFAATVPNHLVTQHPHPRVKVLPLPFAVPDLAISMVWHERRHHEPAIKWLRDVTRETAHMIRERYKRTE